MLAFCRLRQTDPLNCFWLPRAIPAVLRAGGICSIIGADDVGGARNQSDDTLFDSTAELKAAPRMTSTRSPAAEVSGGYNDGSSSSG